MPVKRDLSSYFEKVGQTQSTSSNFQKKSFKIENCFVPKEKDGKFTVVLRFLPSCVDEFTPFIENRTHMFQLPNGSWFGSDCLSKFGKPCPICDYNREQFKKYTKEEAKTKSFGKYKSKYICNILVIRNPNAPESEGKVYRFEFGPQIMKMISAAMTDRNDPEAGLIKGFNPFDWKTGANFVFEGIKSGNSPIKYDTSHFGPQRPINKWNGESFVELTDAEIDDIESKLYTLQDCCRKEEECRDYQGILDFFEKKAGHALFDVAPSSFSKPKAPATEKTEETYDNIFGEEKSEKSEPVETTSTDDVTDTDDFFASLTQG